MPNLAFMLLLVLPSALLAILSLEGAGLSPAWAFVAKPLTTVLILAWAWRRGQGRQARLMWLGLGFSLAGDVCLLWPEAGFLPGLLSFLCAHLAYISAFCVPARLGRPWWPWLVFGLLAAHVLSRLWPGVPEPLRGAVLVYVVCLAAMAAQAWSWWRSSHGTAQEHLARWAAWGGTLFVFSDAMLAIDRFLQPLHMAHAWVLTSYWLAQWCMAMSVSRAPTGAAELTSP